MIRQLIMALIAGLIFGVGLAIGGMVNPKKVIDFLDIAGNWDPTLLCVLGGALTVTLIGYRLVLRRSQPLFASEFRLPKRNDIDLKLVAGAAVFGIGWGLVGFCPGPAIAAVGLGSIKPVVFVIAMSAGAYAASFSTRNI